MADFDWDKLGKVGRPIAAMLWTFTRFVDLIMLNMLWPIIMDVYSEVKGAVGVNAETLLSQACEIILRAREVRNGSMLSIDVGVESLLNPFADVGKNISIWRGRQHLHSARGSLV